MSKIDLVLYNLDSFLLGISWHKDEDKIDTFAVGFLFFGIEIQ
jgi:hypothetical protein